MSYRSTFMFAPRARARALAVLGVATTVLGVASCGSRTGLFGPESGDLYVADAQLDARRDGGRDAEPDGATPCVPGKFGLELATAQLMFVLDRSGSMAFTLAGAAVPTPGDPSRWTILRDALAQTVTPLDQQIAMGAKFFPEVVGEDDLSDPDMACKTDTGVGIAPSLGNAQKILDVFDTSHPRGGTPTAEAVRLAAQDLVDRRTVARTIVLATDGAPNCNGDLDSRRCICTQATGTCRNNPYSCLDDTRAVDVIREAAEIHKIPVFVIGIGSTERPEFLDVLDQMAIAGGRPRATTPRHYNIQSGAELKSALETINDSIAKCTYLTPSAPTDPDAITIQLNGAVVPRDKTHKNGWDWVDQTYGTIAFFGDACTDAQATAGRIDGQVSCEKD